MWRILAWYFAVWLASWYTTNQKNIANCLLIHHEAVNLSLSQAPTSLFGRPFKAEGSKAIFESTIPNAAEPRNIAEYISSIWNQSKASRPGDGDMSISRWLLSLSNTFSGIFSYENSSNSLSLRGITNSTSYFHHSNISGDVTRTYESFSWLGLINMILSKILSPMTSTPNRSLDLSPNQRYLSSKYKPSYQKIQLICEKRDSGEGEDNRIVNNKLHGHIQPHNFTRGCPIVYDYQATPHQPDHMCVSSSKDSICVFRIPNVVISVWGALLDKESLRMYSFDHPSIGMSPPIYYPGVHLKWQTYYSEVLAKTPISIGLVNTLKVYDIVVPTRMRWDDHFNHLSHQSIPIIAYVYEFFPEIFSSVYWHCSVFTAALLLLIEDVPKDHVLIQSLYQKRDKQQPIVANTLLMPWVEGWSPPQTSTLYGISNRILKKITKNLLNRFKGKEQLDKHILQSKKRTILYLSRPSTGSRGVTNEDELVNVLRTYINHEKYDFIVINSTIEQKSVEEMWRSWHAPALYFSRARVIIGPHGRLEQAFYMKISYVCRIRIPVREK